MKIKNLLAVLLAVVCLSTSAQAISQNDIAPVMEQKIDTILEILQEKGLEKEQKAEKIFAIVEEIFDYRVMSRISLGKKWKTISKAQQEAFTKLFEQKLKKSYMDKLDLYTDEKVKILSVEQTKKNRIKLLTELIGQKDKMSIQYKFYRTKAGDWLIYDVDIIGVSVIQTYRKQFAEFLKKKSFDELLETL